MVRLSKIVIDAERIDEYNARLKEGIESAMRLEPGVLTLYAVSEKDAPEKVPSLRYTPTAQLTPATCRPRTSRSTSRARSTWLRALSLST